MIELNEKQLEAVRFKDGVCVVIAVPGSGKTLTMTHRIGHLVNSGIAPENILGLTFTRNAAMEMKSRLALVLEEKASRVMLSTIHSFCHFVLRNEGKVFEILDGRDQVMFIKKIMTKLKIRDLSIGMVLTEIRLSKNNLISLDEFTELYQGDTSMLKVASVYKTYEDEKAKKLLMDFDDLLLETIGLLKENEHVRDKYRSMFKHLMVDEYQDTNPAQMEIIRLLAEREGDNESSLWVCGDDWQSIYAFTGASVGNILNFTEMFPGASEVMLNLNYRSTPQILKACQNLIRHNLRKIDKELLTGNKDGEDVIVLECASEEDEAMIVTAEIQDLTERKGYSHDCISVLYRCNFQSRILEEVFSKNRVPYRVENGLGFYQRKEVRDLLSYLTLINDPDSDRGDEALKSIINIPNRYIGKKFVAELENHATEKGLHLYRALKEMWIEPVYLRRIAKAFVEFLDPLIEQADGSGPAEVVRILREGLDYDRYITDEDIPSPDDQKIQNVNQLQMAAVKFEEISGFLDYTDSFQDELVSKDKSGVRLMTIHKAKGLEFRVVFVVGLVEGILPTKKGDIEEERRVCFVAMSRAMDLLYLSHCHNYLGQPAKKSVFLEEISGLNQPG